MLSAPKMFGRIDPMKDLVYKIEISARHVHLSPADFKVLFGADAVLGKVCDLSISGEFKSDQTVTIVGPKRNLERVAVLGPLRAQTQVEVSVTDTYTLGVANVPSRLSGDLAGSAPVKLRGPQGEIDLPEGMIIARRHLHISRDDMAKYGLTNGQKIDIVAGDARAVTFHQVVVRESAVACPTVHLDTDEGNAFR